MPIKCWDCGQELYGYSLDDLNRSFDQGYLQAVRDLKGDKMERAACATTKRKIQDYENH